LLWNVSVLAAEINGLALNGEEFVSYESNHRRDRSWGKRGREGENAKILRWHSKAKKREIREGKSSIRNG